MPSLDPRRPNVLFVLTDDQGSWALGCAGNSEIRTPNLDRLAATGIRFDSFFCTSPVCSPARASLLTGRIPSQHGVHDWLRAGNTTIEPEKAGRLIEYLKGQTGYTDILAAAGYECGLSGKWHLGDCHHPQKGFSFWEAHSKGGGMYYDAPMIKDGEIVRDPRYVTDLITDNALRFLGQQVEVASPFYLSVHYTAPHSPWGRDEHPHDVYDAYHSSCPFESVPLEPKHPWQVNSAPCGYDDETRRAILSGYYAAVTEMDRNLGRLLDWLEERGLRENTLIFFTSDNGMNMGHHGIYGKGNGTFPQNMYEESVKVPAIVSRPGHIAEDDVCTDMLSHYDFMPTLLEYLGLGSPEEDSLPGRSFAGLLRGDGLAGRDCVVVYDEYGPVRMIRTQDWKYVHRYPYGPNELWDLRNDPGECHNLIDDPAHQGTVVALKAGLEEWFAKYTDPLLDGRVEPVTGKGQVGLAGPAGGGEKNFSDDWFYVPEDMQWDGPQGAPK